MDDILYVLADGGRARLVERNEAGDFVTVAELDQRAELETLRQELRSSPPPRTFDRPSGSRHAVGREGGDYLSQSKAAFMEQVGAAAAERARKARAQGVVIAAPPRLLKPLREQLETRAKVVGWVSKDLTNTPDHDLARWLESAATSDS